MSQRVLIVDDSPTVGMTVGWVLSDHGYEISMAESGIAALSLMKSFQPDLVVLDIRLPHVDGYQICRMIRRMPQFRELPILMLSGLSGENHVQEALNAGANGYLVKPVRDVDLLNAVNQYVPSRQPATQA